jgi:GNAT superfamily N-acetyltransferase
MDTRLSIERVTSRRGLLEFVRFPFRLYRRDPNWAPPFIEERMDFFAPAKNPFFEHARCQLFLARRDGELVGTIAAAVDDNHNSVHDERMGTFGFFEAVDDPDVVRALLGAAEEWVRGQGMAVMRGPLSFSTNHECGLLIEGFDESPMVMTPYNPRYYQRLIEDSGYQKVMDLFAYIIDVDEARNSVLPTASSVVRRAAQRQGIRVRKADLRHFTSEIQLVKEVYNRAWMRNWGFVPMTEHEFDHLATSLRPWLDPDLILLAEAEDGTPVGVSIALPDLYQPLRSSRGGHLFPLGLLRFLWHRRRINQIRLLIMGVVEEHRRHGIEAMFCYETVRAALARHYRRIEISWVLETNTMANRIAERLGGKRYKTYRVYERSGL